MTTTRAKQIVRIEASVLFTTSNVRDSYVVLRVRDVGSGDRLVNIELNSGQFMQLMSGGIVSTEMQVPA